MADQFGQQSSLEKCIASCMVAVLVPMKAARGSDSFRSLYPDLLLLQVLIGLHHHPLAMDFSIKHHVRLYGYIRKKGPCTKTSGVLVSIGT